MQQHNVERSYGEKSECVLFYANPCTKADFSWDSETFSPTSKEELESWELPASFVEYFIKN